MELREIISSGRYRDCYATDNPDICVKRLKSAVQKKYFGITVGYPAKIYTKGKFGIGNVNHHEHAIFSRLPHELTPYVPRLIEVRDNDLIVERVRDATGEYSSTLQEHGSVRDKNFWQHVHRIKDIFIQNQLWFLDVFHKGNNILVKKDIDGNISPMLIDLKRVGRDMYPFQINLLFPGQVQKKFHRRFKKFEAHFRA